MKEPLQHIQQYVGHAHGYATGLDGREHGADHVRGRLEDVRPDEVEHVHERVLAAQSVDAQCDVRDGRGGGLLGSGLGFRVSI